MSRSKGKQQPRKNTLDGRTPPQSNAQTQPVAKKNTPASSATLQQRFTQRQLAAQQRIQQRRRMQIIGAGILVVVLVIAAIIGVQFMNQRANAPVTFTNLPATPTTDTAPFTLGNPDASVTLIEYGDFRCSACEQYFTDAEKTIRQKYVDTGKVKYVFRNYTVIDQLLGDDGSTRAAQAGYCAADQKRFWDYHDVLYSNYIGEKRGAPTIKYLEDLAKALNLNTEQFNSCLESGRDSQKIAGEMSGGMQQGVTGTPTFFIKVGDKETRVTITSAGYVAGISAQLDEALKNSGASK